MFCVALLLAVTGCENGGDCLKTAGDLAELELEMDAFSSILVNEDISLVISQGDEYGVKVVTGENLIEDFKAEVDNGQLILTMENTCELLREYKTTKVYVTAPDITEIISSTQFDISSDGVLDFDTLTLRCTRLTDDRWVVSGEFFLQLRVQKLNIRANELANFEVSGTADQLDINLADGDVRAYLADLVVREAQVYHRSAQDITLNATESVRGGLWSTGDLILVNTPPVVEVSQNYKGKVVYR